MYSLLSIMPRNTPILFPAVARQLAALGERLRLARLRRRYSAEAVAVRAGITRVTLARIEKGEAGTSLGAYVAILRVLGLHGGLDGIAKDDELGRKLQDLGLLVGRRAPRRVVKNLRSAHGSREG
jgi:transcriptional regulator with XRE-family HTH domain